MGLGALRSLIVPSLILLALLWVFNRPLTALSLFFYQATGSFISETINKVQTTQKEAKDLFKAESRAQELERVNQLLSIDNKLLVTQVKKLERLQAALDFKSQFSYKTIAAKVIGRSPNSWYKQFIINKGSEHGVKPGRGVLTSRGIIGQVYKVGLNSSIVQLVYNQDWRMGAKIKSLDQYGVLNGNYPGPAQLQFIAVDVPAQVGDEIISSGVCLDADNCPYPENYPVGKIIEVEKDPNVVDLVVKVAFNEDLQKVNEVFVLN